MVELAEDKANFCLNTGVQPSEYDALTGVETEAFIKVHNKNVKKNR